MFKNVTLVSANPNCPNCGSDLQIVPSSEDKDFSIENTLFECIVCGFRYTYVAVQDPDDDENKKEIKSLNCEFCHKHFNQSSALKRHLIVHSAERPFCCDECDKSFKTKAALKRHSIIHTGECPFECSTCKKKFNQISNLRKHLVIHNNNCPFYCTICGKGFNQLSNMKKHANVHDCKVSPAKKKPDYLILPKGLEKNVTRPVLTFIKPAES